MKELDLNIQETDTFEEPEIDMLRYEREAWDSGAEYIAGIDEVGRGCLFGDVVAAAVILPKGLVLEGVNDSKKLSDKKRELLFDIIMKEAVSVGIGIVDVETIDRINIRQASRLAMKQAVLALTPSPDHLLVDAETVDVPLPQLSIIKGDANSQSIGAASIIAKVTRDRMCKGSGMLCILSTVLLYIKGMRQSCTESSCSHWDLHRCIAEAFSEKY